LGVAIGQAFIELVNAGEGTTGVGVLIVGFAFLIALVLVSVAMGGLPPFLQP